MFWVPEFLGFLWIIIQQSVALEISTVMILSFQTDRTERALWSGFTLFSDRQVWRSSLIRVYTVFRQTGLKEQFDQGLHCFQTDRCEVAVWSGSTLFSDGKVWRSSLIRVYTVFRRTGLKEQSDQSLHCFQTDRSEGAVWSEFTLFSDGQVWRSSLIRVYTVFRRTGLKEQSDQSLHCFQTDRSEGAVWSAFTLFSDRQVWRSSLIRVHTVCHFVCIFWTHYSMVKPHCSNFRIITLVFLGTAVIDQPMGQSSFTICYLPLPVLLLGRQGHNCCLLEGLSDKRTTDHFKCTCTLYFHYFPKARNPSNVTLWI